MSGRRNLLTGAAALAGMAILPTHAALPAASTRVQELLTVFQTLKEGERRALLHMAEVKAARGTPEQIEAAEMEYWQAAGCSWESARRLVEVHRTGAVAVAA